MTAAPVSEAGTSRGPGPALVARDIAKAFLGTQALSGVDLELHAGEVHGLLGENGSGKSTLVKILAGVYQADQGAVAVASGARTDAAGMSPTVARHLGVRVVHQDPAIFGMLTVAENLFLGSAFPTRRGGAIDWRAAHRHARWALDRFQVPARPEQLCQELDPAVRAMVAVARALQDCEDASEGVLILDEPTAALTESEVETLLTAVRRYADEGQAILLVTHRLEEVLDTCRRVTVLRDGLKVATRAREDVERRDLVELIVGRDLGDEPSTAAGGAGAASSATSAALRLSGLTAPPLQDVSLRVRTGEIVGVAGLIGSGRTELLMTIFGERPRTAGGIEVHGHPLAGHGASEAIAHGVALVPEDRRTDALFAALTVGENLSAGVPGRFWHAGRMDRARERAETRELIERFDINPPDESATMSNLSGGNQQKVVLASWLRRDPRLLLLDEPTQGVDVGARTQIHGAVRSAVAGGAAALVVSSELDELIDLADRIVVLVAGRLIAELTGEDIDRERIAALTHAEPEAEAATMAGRR